MNGTLHTHAHTLGEEREKERKERKRGSARGGQTDTRTRQVKEL